VNSTFQTWKEECKNGSAPQINAAAVTVKEHIGEAEELLNELQQANGTSQQYKRVFLYGYSKDISSIRGIREQMRPFYDNSSKPLISDLPMPVLPCFRQTLRRETLVNLDLDLKR